MTYRIYVRAETCMVNTKQHLHLHSSGSMSTGRCGVPGRKQQKPRHITETLLNTQFGNIFCTVHNSDYFSCPFPTLGCRLKDLIDLTFSTCCKLPGLMKMPFFAKILCKK